MLWQGLDRLFRESVTHGMRHAEDNLGGTRRGEEGKGGSKRQGETPLHQGEQTLSLKLEQNEELLDKALEKMESLEKSLALTKTAGTGAIDPGKKVTNKKKKKNSRTKE